MEFKINLNDVSIREKSKKEVYLVLTAEGGLYLPPLIDSNKSYLKGKMNGTKKFLYWKDVSVVKLPQLKSLSIKEILSFAINNTNIGEYLHEYTYDKLPNREWLWNVVNTISGRKFKEFVQTALNKRETDIFINKGLNVSAIPEIVKNFENSKNVSYNKGRTHFLISSRSIKLKRKYKEMECDGFEEEKKKKKTREHEEKIKQLEVSISIYEEREDGFLKDKEKLVKLYQLGKIDSDGEFID